MTNRNIEEAIYKLQKSDPENGVKQLVEEAAQLFASGRHMEAGALLEKAEAIVATRGTPRPAAAPAGPHDDRKLPEHARVDEQAIANVASKLADGLATILTGAFHELERHIIRENVKITTSLEMEIGKLHSTVESLTQLRSKFEHLAEAVTEQKSNGAAMGQKHDQVSSQVAALLETTARHEAELAALRAETTTLRSETVSLRTDAKQFSANISQQVDGMSTRLGLQHEELAGLKSNVSDISGKVAGCLERLDRQAEVIRSLNETQVRRTAALDELLGVLTRLKAPPPAESVVAAAAAGPL